MATVGRAAEEPSLWPAALLLLLVSTGVHLATPTLHDSDSLYHLRHTWLYWHRGLLDSSFPWAVYSIVREKAADLWYGFHLVSLPLIGFADLLASLRVGGVAVTFAVLWALFLTFRGLGAPLPTLWALATLWSSADVLYRLTMFRPHPLTLALVAVLFLLWLPGRREAPRERTLAIVAIGFLLAWIHLALIWLPLVVALVVSLVYGALRRRASLREWGALGIGLLTGALLRPHPVAALELGYVQIVRLFLEKLRGTPLGFGRELLPLGGQHLVDQYVPLCVLTIAAFVYMLPRLRKAPEIEPRARVAFLSSALLAIIFFAVAFLQARRAIEYASAFGMVSIAVACGVWLASQPSTRQRAMIGACVALLAIAMLSSTSHRYGRYVDVDPPADRYRGAAEWLARNARPDAIVFHANWEDFGDLFFWNPSQRYVNGMDPIFQYALDPSSYWKLHCLASGQASAGTCGASRCSAGELRDTATVIAKDFRASYVVVPMNGGAFQTYLENSPAFARVFADESAAVYEVR